MLLHWICVIFAVLCTLFEEASSAACTNADKLGTANINSNSGSLDSNSNQQYLMTDAEFTSPCCGVVTEWEIYAGVTGDITFQVWRPSGSSAVLIGENQVTVDSLNEFTYSVPTVSQISIETSDIIGWYSATTDIVEYKSAGSENDNNYIETISPQPSVGDTVTYSNIQTDRTYAIYVTLGPANAPTFTNLDATVNDYASLVTTGTLMYTLTSSSSNAVTFTLDTITPSSHFSVDPTTGEVTANTNSVSATTYTLDISVAESCSASTSATLTIVLSATAPVWSNLDAVISVSKTDVSTTIPAYTVLATNPVINGSVTYTLQSITPASSDLTVDTNTGDVTPTTSQLTGATYTLDIRATDVYGNFADGTLTLTIVNLVPEITSLPDVVDISESAVDETLLHIVNVTDADGDDITCTMTSSPSGPFMTKYLSINGVLTTGLYLQAIPGLDYDSVNAYELSVTCSDGEVNSNTGILYVYVTPNNVPFITNLQNTTSILSTTPSSTIIFQILSTDAEDDTAYFTLACEVASPCPFSIFSDGSISLSSSLISTTTKGYELDISVRDDYSSSGTHRLTVFVSDLNTQPDLYNLPGSIQVPEDTRVGTILFDVSVYDEDGDTQHTFTASFDPASSSALFKLNSTTGEVILASALNYLTQDNNYDITVEVSDDLSTSTSKDLTIEVVDVNQVPVLYQINYQVEINEGPAGTVAPNPGFNVYDPDGDTLTYSWGSGTGSDDTSGFSINSNDGTVSLTIDFDVDDTSVTTHFVWLVVIADPEGLSCTATLTLSINDINDNLPSFDSSDYAAVVYSNARLSKTVLTVMSTDKDRSAEYRDIAYSIHNTNLFGIDNGGNIFVSSNLDAYEDTIESFTVRAKNPTESSYNQANVYISISKPEDNEDFFDDTANIVWVTLVCIFGPAVLIALAYLSYLACNKWAAFPVTRKSPGTVVQIAPSDTKMGAPPSRASLVTRGTAVVTPSDVKVIDERWEAWRAEGWQT